MKQKRQPHLNLSHLEILTSAAETGSFSETALQLEMSQSSVSNAIATLEDHLGVVLFARGRHGARLTPVGEQVWAIARRMLQMEDDIFKEANLSRSLHGGEVRISSFRSVSTNLLPEAIAQFQTRYPEISVKIIEHLDNASIEDDLRKGRADLGFIDLPLGDEFESWELIHDEYIAIFPSTFEPTGGELSWSDLTRFPIIFGLEGDAHDIEVTKHCAQFGVSLEVAHHVRADSTIVSMVARGLGASIMPRMTAEPLPANIQPFSLPVPLFRTIRVSALANALKPPAVFAFLELLQAIS